MSDRKLSGGRAVRGKALYYQSQEQQAVPYQGLSIPSPYPENYSNTDDDHNLRRRTDQGQSSNVSSPAVAGNPAISHVGNTTIDSSSGKETPIF